MLNFLANLWDIIQLTNNIINSTVSVIKLCLLWSIFSGKIIVDVATKCALYILHFASTVKTVLTILAEEFSYFLTDVQNIISIVEKALIYMFEWMWNSTVSIYTIFVSTPFIIMCSVINIRDNIYNLFQNILKVVYTGILTVKGSLILLGNIIWMGFMFIPGILFYVFSILAVFVNRSCEEILSILGTLAHNVIIFCFLTIEFIADTPLESLLGLFVGLCLLCFIIKYGYHAFKPIKKLITYLECLLVKLCISVKCKVNLYLQEFMNKIYNKRHTIPDVTVTVNEITNERLCVVCKDRETEIVVLPCSHMCLCVDCSAHPAFLGRKLGACPVCRKSILRKLRVYNT